MSERKYLRDVLPRVYDEAIAWLRTHHPEAVRQLDHLFVTGRCSCGACSDFTLDSDLPELSKANGSVKLLRPFYWDMHGGYPMIGLTENDDSTVNVSSFEMVGSDYPDEYVHRQLEAHGFIRPPAQFD